MSKVYIFCTQHTGIYFPYVTQANTERDFVCLERRFMAFFGVFDVLTDESCDYLCLREAKNRFGIHLKSCLSDCSRSSLSTFLSESINILGFVK